MIKQTLFIFVTVAITIYSQIDSIASYYNNGNLKSVVHLNKNVRDGEARFYWENGNIKQELNYFNGRVNGLVRNYSDNGLLTEMFIITDGKREGPATYFDSTGVYDRDVLYTEGRLDVEEIPLRHSKSEEQLTANTNDVKKTKNKKKKVVIDPNQPLPPTIKEERNLAEDPAFYLSVEVMPEPIGGMNAIYKKISYPKQARENNIEGTVIIRAYVDRDGEVLEAELVEGIGSGCDESARLAVFYHRFKPGLQRGQRVKVQLDIPVEFKLEKEE